MFERAASLRTSRPPRRGRVASASEPIDRGLPDGLALLLIGIALLAFYVPTLSDAFFADDYQFLDQVRSRSLGEVLTQRDAISDFVRPVSRQAWFWSIGRLSGERPLVFHAANLALLSGIVLLIAVLGRRLAGARAGWLAAALLAQHYVADVPVRWASGSQDLLAVLGALVALLLYLNGRAVLAGVTLLLAMLSKETVVVTPLIAVVLAVGNQAGKRAIPTRGMRDLLRRNAWLRAWPLFAATILWAAFWLSRSRGEARAATGVGFDPIGLPAALFHLPQVALGAEWSSAWLPAVLAAAFWPTLLLLPVALARPPTGMKRTFAGTIRAGTLWAILATVPIAAVAAMWSAYYYLFAMCGVALALGAWLADKPRRWTVAAVLILGLCSAHARVLGDFARARSSWTLLSHVNGSAIEQGTVQCSRYLASLHRLQPTFPPRSTIFFAGLQPGVIFQASDGPLIRWSYRDPTLRSYYLGQFTRERARDGPVFLFVAAGDSLRNASPGEDPLPAIGFAQMVGDRLDGARDAFELAGERGDRATWLVYWRAWLAWALGDFDEARSGFARSGVRENPGPAPQTAAALVAVEAGDTAMAIALMQRAVEAFGTDAGAHGLLADLLLMREPTDPNAVIEAIAARALAPRDPFAWRRLAMIQMSREREPEALASLQRYLEMAPEAGRGDPEAQRWVAALRNAGDPVGAHGDRGRGR